MLGILKAFALRSSADGAKLRDRWQPGIDVAARSGRADSGDIEIDLVELFTEVAGLAADVGTGVAILIDEMQDLRPDDVSALCAACHELSQSRAPLVVVGAGLPHLPAVLSASKSYSERLFRYSRIGQLDRKDADFALLAPAEREDATFDADALDALFDASSGYPYFVQAYGKAAWDAAARSPITAADVKMAAPEAEAELAVGFFGSRYERATPAEREYLRAMAELTEGRDEPVGTSGVADHLQRRASSLSPARDSLLKKGLVFSAQRGQIAFTVPHFGRYLLANGVTPVLHRVNRRDGPLWGNKRAPGAATSRYSPAVLSDPRPASPAGLSMSSTTQVVVGVGDRAPWAVASDWCRTRNSRSRCCTTGSWSGHRRHRRAAQQCRDRHPGNRRGRQASHLGRGLRRRAARAHRQGGRPRPVRPRRPVRGRGAGRHVPRDAGAGAARRRHRAHRARDGPLPVTGSRPTRR